jgi:energy-coupling factor transporter ATP-binding protein EcfA2
MRACVRVAPVTQAYDEDRNVLEGISLKIPEGAKVGVLGRSGCGKSTLLKLMARVYQPRQGGSVRYFGQPLNEVMLDEVASFMQQQNVLFDDTVSTFKPPSEQSPQTFPCSHELPCFHGCSLTLLGCLRHPFICADANIALGLFEDNVRTRAARHANSLTERARGRTCVCVFVCVWSCHRLRLCLL